MPLLNRRPFVRKEPPSDLHPHDKVFFSDITNEVFTEYEEYWERLVLCNAMVWTCELTGRPNLTYGEASESESKARKCLANVPQALRKPMLYIATLTRRGRYADMSEDVFNFIRDRYFVGEEVEAIVKNHWYDCRVIRPIYPTPEEIAKYQEDMEDSEEEGDSEKKDKEGVEGFKIKENGEVLERGVSVKMGKQNEEIIENGDDDVQVIKEVVKVNNKSEDKKKVDEDEDYPPFATFKYEVIEIEPWDYKVAKKHVVSWEQIRRNKGVFTREKCKLFLKQCVHLSPSGYWVIKDSTAKRYDLANVQYSEIFLGEPPKFRETRAKKMPVNLNPDKMEKKRIFTEKKRREKKEAGEKNLDGDIKKRGRPFMTEQEKEARKKMMKELKNGLKSEKKVKLREELKQRLEKEKEERKKEREIRKEVKRLRLQYVKDWKRVRDDLDCDDHKDLPKPIPIQCRIPDDLFSDFIMVLEFINVFSELLELKDVYPQGITFDMLEHGLVEKEIAGVFNDMLQLLLQSIFTLQEEEDDEVEADNNAEEVMETDTTDITIQEAVRVANRASTWSQQYHGLPLQKVPLDALTVTEVLRLHLLASGATSVANGRWRHFNRGGFKNLDDPGLQFKLEEPLIIKSLATQTIFDLPLVHKLKILSVLIGQILTYASVRDIIEDNMEKLREMKNKLRLHQFTQIRKEKELNAARLQEKRDRKQKERERLLKEAEKKAAAAAMTGEPDKPIEVEEEEDEEEEEEEDEIGKAAREEKEEKNKEARRQDFLKRERELMQQVLSVAQGVNATPLGQDRAYRRYWLFSSLPGLFVEHNEEHPGMCRATPTPYDPNSNPEVTDALQELLRVQAEKNLTETTAEKEDKSNSDKENDGNDSPAKQAKGIICKKLLQTPNHFQHSSESKTFDKPSLSPHAVNGAESMLKMEISSRTKMNSDVEVETGDIKMESSDIDMKVESSDVNMKMESTDINVKMESSGTDDIKMESSNNSIDCETGNDIVGCFTNKVESFSDSHGPMPDIFGLCAADDRKCPVHCERMNQCKWFFFHNTEDLNSLILSLNSRGYREKELKKALECYRTSIETSMRSCPVYKLDPSQEPELEKAIRKSQRNMTTKKDGDANLNFPPGTPMEEILQHTLRDMILETEEKIHMGMLGSLRLENREVWRQAILEGNYVRGAELDFGGRKRISQLKVELGLEVNEEQDTVDILGEATETGTVKDLAQAILQLGQSIDSKYLQSPLGETDKARKMRESAEEKLRKESKQNTKEEEGGTGSDGDSDEDEDDSKGSDQVTDNALRTPIERWEMSLMASTSLSQLCLHYATLDNSITWSRSALNARCRICRRKADAENMLLCDNCDKGHHIYCLKPKLKEIPSGDWFCDRCKPKEKPKSPRKNRHIYKDVSDDDEELDEDSEEEESDIINDNWCYVCEKPGSLVCCSTCPLAFHQECAELRKVPRGSWSCQQCQGKYSPSEKKKNIKEASRSSKDSNKENSKSKRDTRNSKNIKETRNNKKPPKSKEKTVKATKSKKSTLPDRKRGSEADDTRVAKKLRDEFECDWTPPKRGSTRRSLVDEESDLNCSALETILDELQRHPASWPFSRPVSKKAAPDYYEIVKKPMDFRKIREKLNSMKYTLDDEFIADVMLVFQNCQQYNMEETEEYRCGTLLSNLFMKRVQELGLSYQGTVKQEVKKKKR
ncbi:bromodomain adjacent to zinc finger domain protein 1A isoform X2 [Panulirus ornatus]|uniref:bromodomain adjacent to zinc finger domain protein 1A isoform X2 n=1 Tax=Panulirus ornatus TaxID=150431 RepID=UPI003A8C51FC